MNPPDRNGTRRKSANLENVDKKRRKGQWLPFRRFKSPKGGKKRK